MRATAALAALALLANLAPAAPLGAQAVPEAPLTRMGIGGDGVMLGNAALSPDGRWVIVDRMDGANRSSLWIAPADGGELVRLTDAGYLDESAAWAPSGDRIFFTSTRAARGSPGYFIMTMRIDPRTGRALDAPRQITLERESGGPVPSPDGRQILYRNGTELRIAPAAGGNSRVVANPPRGGMRYAWEPDGSAIYYAAPNPAKGGPSLYRVAASGGTPTELANLPRRTVMAIAPASRRAVLLGFEGGPRERTIEVVDFTGRVVGRQVVTTDYMVRGISPDGRTALVVSSDVGAVMRARPVAGGEPVDLTDGRSYDWPVAWTADSRNVIIHGERDGEPVTRILPLGGGAAREIALPAEDAGARLDWGTPTHVSYRVPTDDAYREKLVALDIATGARTVLSESAVRGGNAIGPGGLYRDVDGVYFAERNGDRVELRSAAPGRAVRTVFSAPVGFYAQNGVAFQGERVAYTEMVGDSLGVMMIDARDAAPRLLMTIGVPRPQEGCCRRTLAFSHDGQWIVAEPVGGEPNVGAVTIARVPRQGRATDVRTIPVEAEYWYEPRWAPDNNGFTIIAGSGMAAWVAWVPTTPGQRVRHLSRGEEGATWGNELSPDGRWVVYPAEVWRGSTLWRMELR
jgi:TolB protein